MSSPGFMIAAPASGSGKTAAACALMSAFLSRGLKVRGLKCGPDYIDPMFHREVLGVESRNLDLFFSSPEELAYTYRRHVQGADIAVTEGVMGYYDGMSVDTDRGSSYDVARTLGLPVILVLPCRGAALSLAASASGMCGFRKDSNIRGILLNRVSGMLYPRLKTMLEEELKRMGYEIPVLGYLPEDGAFALESRHLGLVTPAEIRDLREQMERAGEILSRTVDLDRLLQCAREGKAEQTARAKQSVQTARAKQSAQENSEGRKNGECWERGVRQENQARQECGVRLANRRNEIMVRVAVARDEAFCFYYPDNLELLERCGCEPVFFSPLRDEKLPDGVCGLILGGGYPELYAERLSENGSLLADIRKKADSGMPCLAECGGFMYLHEELEDGDGNRYPMAGLIKGCAYPAGKLVRFGYISVSAVQESGMQETPWLLPGEKIRGHEFHYWDSTDSGGDCLAVKPDGRRQWKCIHVKKNLFAGYPHLYLPSLPAFAERFAESCAQWNEKKGRNMS